MDQYLIWALLIGGLSAVSLPLGSAVGLGLRPRPALTGIAAAFGAGALIAALSVELVAPTAEGLHHAHGKLHLFTLIGGAVVGGVLFVILDQLVSAHGGFLRKSATTIAYFTTQSKKRNREVLENLSRISILRSVPPEHVMRLVDEVHPARFLEGDCVCREGHEGDKLFFIQDGELDIFQEGKWFKKLGPGEIVGEIALLTGAHRTATIIATKPTQTWVLEKEAFDRLREECPALDEETRKLAARRLDELRVEKESHAKDAAQWAHRAAKALETKAEIPTPDQVKRLKEETPGAPLAIWLGILLDGIPESLVIGVGFLGALTHQLAASGSAQFSAAVPYTLIAGLFLSNFPEAMSSSVGMRVQGWKWHVTLAMWSALMVLTAMGAAVGYALGGALSASVVIGIQGMAAGAMLTMIASTMIPEAVHMVSAPAVGLSTLTGFLTAVSFKIFEAH